MKKRNEGLDILKAICSFLIVYIHVPNSLAWRTDLMVLCRIGVPIFFMISGYFWNDMQKYGGEKRQIVKTLKIIGAAVFIHLIWQTCYRWMLGVSLQDYWRDILTTKNMLRLLLFNDFFPAEHLWYLFAILYVWGIAFVLEKMDWTKYMYKLIPVLLLGQWFFENLSSILQNEYPYILSRNFLWTGLPYFLIGSFIKNHEKEIADKFSKYSFVYIWVMVGVSLLEYWFLGRLNFMKDKNSYITTVFLATAVFWYFLKNSDQIGVVGGYSRKLVKIIR